MESSRTGPSSTGLHNIVAVIGAGASGTITAAHLARAAARSGSPLRILLIDEAVAGRGVAYSTRDPRHRLNVPAKGMSVWPDDPSHFLRWMRRHVDVDYPETGFAPRVHYASYLADVLSEAERRSDVDIERVRARAADVSPHGQRLRVSITDGTTRAVDAVVLALGYGTPRTDWAPESLRRSPRFVPDPWQADDPEPGAGHREVVIVGSGLTGADMALRWSVSGARLHLVSRHGLLPLSHASAPAAPAPPPEVPDAPITARAARRLVFDAVRAADGDWRRAIDGLRPVTAQIWSRMPEPERGMFLATGARRWDRVRHRVDPAMHAWLEQRRTEGALIPHAGHVVSAVDADDHVAVQLSDGSTVRASAVVNCTGASSSVTANSDPLVMNLLTSGLISPGPLDMGVATDERGQVVGADRSTGAAATAGGAPAVWAVGPLRRGELWESTAIPEIRVHAAQVSAAVLAGLPARARHRRPRDPYGLPLSATAAAAEAYTGGLARILRVQSGAEELIRAAVDADPSFALGHAVLAMLGVEWGAQVDVEAALAAADAAGARADERERRFVEVATARVREPGPDSAAALLSYIGAYPEDALAVSLAVPTIAFGGATEIPAEAWALVDGLAPAYGEDWWYLGMQAFMRQEQERFDEAGELAARALAVEPGSGHAVHAKAHVHYETGDHRSGLAWLDRWIATSGAQASHRAHFSWHAALHELSLGDDAAVARRYAGQLSPPSVCGVRALVDSASLLWRARAVGAHGLGGSEAIGAVLSTVPDEYLFAPSTAFVAMHAAVALTAAGDCAGLARLRRHAEAQDGEVFTTTVAPLADALCDLVHGDADRATDRLLALTGVERLGGSAAQREIVEDTLIHSAAVAGRGELAAALLDQRLQRRDSDRDRARRRRLHVPN